MEAGGGAESLFVAGLGSGSRWLSDPEPKNPPANAGDLGSIPGSGRPPGVVNGNPLQYPCLENAMDKGAW